MNGSILIGNIDKPIIRGTIYVNDVKVDTPEELRVALKVLGKTSGEAVIIKKEEDNGSINQTGTGIDNEES